jgi:hypothetical protein
VAEVLDAAGRSMMRRVRRVEDHENRVGDDDGADRHRGDDRE